MFSDRYFDTHRSWEDWFGMVLGLLMAVSPWVVEDHVSRAAAWNAVVVGVLLFFLAELEYAVFHRWEEIGELALGLWLIASPYFFGFYTAGAFRFWHSTIGGLVILLAALELWQDQERTRPEIARRGKALGH